MKRLENLFSLIYDIIWVEERERKIDEALLEFEFYRKNYCNYTDEQLIAIAKPIFEKEAKYIKLFIEYLIDSLACDDIPERKVLEEMFCFMNFSTSEKSRL